MHRFNQSRRATQTSIAIHDSPSLLPHYEAVLIMDAQPASASVRTQAFSSHWSRVYRAGNYYVDLTLQPGWASPVLLGRVVPVRGRDQSRRELKIAAPLGHGSRMITVDATGFFRVELGYQDCSRAVTLALEDATVSVSGLATN